MKWVGGFQPFFMRKSPCANKLGLKGMSAKGVGGLFTWNTVKPNMFVAVAFYSFGVQVILLPYNLVVLFSTEFQGR